MKRLLAATALSLALVSSAHAADYEATYGKWSVKYVSGTTDTHQRMCSMLAGATNASDAVILFKTLTSGGELQMEVTRKDWNATLQSDGKYPVSVAFNGQWATEGMAKVWTYAGGLKTLTTYVTSVNAGDFLNKVGNASSMWIGFKAAKTWDIDRVGAADAVKAFAICTASLPDNKVSGADLPMPPAFDANRPTTPTKDQL